MNIILRLLRPDPHVIELEDGSEIHGHLHNGEAVHIKNSDGKLYVAIGEIPPYGSPEVSPVEALAIIQNAAVR